MVNELEPAFSVITGAQVDRVIRGHEKGIIKVVEDTYRAHGDGQTVNPPSYFLRFPDRPSGRIIALPASIPGIDGIKWIASYPQNVARGLPRASAVIILNDPQTGYPLACVEGSIISAARTAASAALAAGLLSRAPGRRARIGFIGTGLIARFVHAFLLAHGWAFDQVSVRDTNPVQAAAFARYLREQGPETQVSVAEQTEDLVRDSDLIVFATVAAEPHVTDTAWFAHGPLVLHLSLRDLGPEVILNATNVVDDVDHCLRENTSPHLAERAVGHRRFVHATLADVLAGKPVPETGQPVVFSPFGLGVLDLAVAAHVHAELTAAGQLPVIDDFFPASRH